MKNTFYRPNDVNINEFFAIVRKLGADLEELKSGNVNEDELKVYLEKLIEDQRTLQHDEDMGVWSLVEDNKMPMDARVDFLYKPTYYATAIMIYSKLHYEEVTKEIENFDAALTKALYGSVGRHFTTTGYEPLGGTLDAMEIFSGAGAGAFVKRYKDMCLDFTALFNGTKRKLIKLVASGDIANVNGGFGITDCTERAMKVLDSCAE